MRKYFKSKQGKKLCRGKALICFDNMNYSRTNKK